MRPLPRGTGQGPRAPFAPARPVAGWLAALLALAEMLGGCLAPGADYNFGLGTNEVVGAIEVPGDAPPDPADVLVVVFQYHYLFQAYDSEKRVYRVSADVRGVDRFGAFRVPMPSDVVKLELVFIAPERLSDEFRFSRQIGIGQVSYRAELPPHSDWYSHFYTYIQPMLSNLIVEQRYHLSNEDQQRLGDWLQTQSARLQAIRKQRGAAPPPDQG